MVAGICRQPCRQMPTKLLTFDSNLAGNRQQLNKSNSLGR